jgi:hypothetical protein
MSVSLLAETLTVDKHLIFPAGGTSRTISSGSGARGTDLTSPVDSSQSLETVAVLDGSIVDLVSTALLGAEAILVGEETSGALAVAGGGVVGSVERTSNAVVVADEVVEGTLLADVVHQAEPRVAEAGRSSSRVGRVLAADEDALVGGGTPQSPLGTFRADPVVVSEASSAGAAAVRLLHCVGSAGHSRHAETVGEVESGIADAVAEAVVVGVSCAFDGHVGG